MEGSIEVQVRSDTLLAIASIAPLIATMCRAFVTATAASMTTRPARDFLIGADQLPITAAGAGSWITEYSVN